MVPLTIKSLSEMVVVEGILFNLVILVTKQKVSLYLERNLLECLDLDLGGGEQRVTQYEVRICHPGT